MGETGKKITLTELAAADGKDGRPAYIAFQDKVFDVSQSPLWDGGLHMAGHLAGRDLTAEFADAPHSQEVFERYPQVGVLKKAPASSPAKGPVIPPWLAWLLKRVPLLKRHPHPMVVHFPIVFMIAATSFTILYLLTGRKSFELTAFNCLGGGVLFIPVAVITGLFTWWLNYQTRLFKPVIVKLILSPVLFALALAAFVWRLLHPAVMENLRGVNIIYLGITILLFPLVTIIGWYGSQITFPVHEE